jgi:predicted RNase H-like HicB family nuclease
MNLTAQFTEIESGFMGQILEWPEVITEGKSIDDCRIMLKDALEEMIIAHKDLGLNLPINKVTYEQFTLEPEYVC